MKEYKINEQQLQTIAHMANAFLEVPCKYVIQKIDWLNSLPEITEASNENSNDDSGKS